MLGENTRKIIKKSKGEENMKRSVLTSLFLISTLILTGSAFAQITSDINLYGASAQFILWRDYADDFMRDQGCTDVVSAQLYIGGSPDGRNAITKGTCGGQTRYFRVSAKASYDGILAMQGNTTNPYRVQECSSAYERRMIDEATCTWTTGQCTGVKCVPVTVGASDVPVECFTQQSTGNLRGPLGGTQTVRDFKANPITWDGAEPCKPMVVPFAFFANTSVTKNNVPINNITSDMAELIFSGQIEYWSDLADVDGVPFDEIPIQVCHRHAGSGTQASIDSYLKSSLAVLQVTGTAGSNYGIWFNDGSTDMMRCINGSGNWSGVGAIGFADADQVLTAYTNTRRLTLNGVVPSKNAIKNGNYNFYGYQHLYGISPNDPLCQFAGNLATNPLWVRNCEMVYERINSCDAFPLRWVGASCE